MRRIILAIVLVSTFEALYAPGQAKAVQTTPIAGEPEYAGNFAARAPDTGQYIPLERLTATQATRMRAMGFGGADVRLEFPGETSSVRFKAGQSVEFIVRVITQERDPLSFVQFFQLTSVKGRRSVQIVNVYGMGVKSEDTSRAHMVPFSATRFGEHFFRIVPQQPLAPGEYSVGTSDSHDGFCFGIDP